MNADILRRLAIVRQLFNAGVEDARRPSPLNGLAILSLHDSIEMFMQLAAEYKQASLDKKANFDHYWTAMEAKGIRLGSREGMKRLNTARVALKHNGLLPDRVEIAGFVALVTNFLADSCQTVFAIEFRSTSRAFLIYNQELRQNVEAAEVAAQKNELAVAMEHLKIAFDRAISYRGREELYDPRGSISNITFFNFGSDGGIGGPKTAKALKELSDVYGEALMVVGYQLDFGGYRLLKTHSPVIHHFFGGSHQTQWMHDPPEDPEIVGRCADFVVDTCLRLQVRDAG